MEYEIIWRIQLDAESPEDAARIALEIQRDAFSEATVFEVTNKDTGEMEEIDPVLSMFPFSEDGECGTAGLEDELREV
jgi:hypothetical protein